MKFKLDQATLNKLSFHFDRFHYTWTFMTSIKFNIYLMRQQNGVEKKHHLILIASCTRSSMNVTKFFFNFSICLMITFDRFTTRNRVVIFQRLLHMLRFEPATSVNRVNYFDADWGPYQEVFARWHEDLLLDSRRGSKAKWVEFLLTNTAALGSNHGFGVFFRENFSCSCVNQQHIT